MQVLLNGVIGKDVGAAAYPAHRAEWLGIVKLGIVKQKRKRPPNNPDRARAALLCSLPS
ncbi:MAG: hypothetical protein ABIO92_08045 [Chloroflexia bacterium]